MKNTRPAARAPQSGAGSSGEESTRKYLYCVIQSKQPQTFGARGVAGPDYPIHTLHYRGLAAVVSDSPAATYEGTRQNMTAHMRVLEEVMREQTILPLKFNSLSATAGDVSGKLLKPAYEELLARLASVAGRVEMGVKAFWREDVLYREIVAANEDIRRLRDRIAGRSPDATYKERIKLGEMVEKALIAKRERESELMLARLRPHAEDIRIREPASERMALNVALLLKSSEQAAFEESLTALDREEGQRMMLKCVGPAPLYNFIQLTLG
jgi:hypothetical protein